MYQIGLSVLIVLNETQMVQDDTGWFEMVPGGYQVVPGGTRWCQVVPGGAKWRQVAPGGTRWCQMVTDTYIFLRCACFYQTYVFPF